MLSLDEPGSEAGPRRPSIFARDWQKALVILLTILAAFALLWVIWQIVTPILHTVILFLLAGILTFALGPPVSLLERRIGNRLVAIGVVSLLFGGLLIGGIVLLAGPFVSQATTLAGDLPRYMEDLQRRTPEIESRLRESGVRVDLGDLQQRLLTAIDRNGVGLLTTLVGSIGGVGGLLVDALLALVIAFYLLVDGPAIRRRVLDVIPAQHQGKALFFEANASRVLGGYLRGQLIMAALMGISAGIGVALLGLPYAVVLGVLAALFALVPMFGPILSAVPAVLVALFQPFPTVVWVLILFVAISQIVTNVLGPRITGHAVGLHPLAAMFALLAGFQVAGFLGGLFAVPLAGILWVLIAAAYRNVIAEPPLPPRRVLLPRLRRREVAGVAAERPAHLAEREGSPHP